MVGVSHLSLTVNSSVNFLIYFSLGKRFQAAAKRSVLQREKSKTNIKRVKRRGKFYWDL